MKGRWEAIGQFKTTPLEELERVEVNVDAYVDDEGWVQNAGFTLKSISALEKGLIDGPKAVVLHRTDSTKVDSPLKSFEGGVGTHFIVDKDGTVYQCASLLKRTAHVGKIRSKCYESGSCSADETKRIKGWGWAPTKIYDNEKVKSYPDRFPLNEDSVGIETVADHDGVSWEAPTADQEKSIKSIVKILQEKYGLTDSDIYEHDNISYKTAGEGADLYSPSAAP